MNQIFVNNIQNCLQHDFKHPDTSFDYEYALHNIKKERVVRDVATDSFVDKVFSDSRNDADKVDNDRKSRNRFNFLAYVYTLLRFKIETELVERLCEENILLENDEKVYLIFKGGSMMYYLYNKLLTYLNNPTNFTNTFNDKFKVSDFDFTIYITVKDPKKFYKVKLIVNKIVYNGLIEVRKFFEDYINYVQANTPVNDIQQIIVGSAIVPSSAINSLEDIILKKSLSMTDNTSLSIDKIESCINEFNYILKKHLLYKEDYEKRNLTDKFFVDLKQELLIKKTDFINNLLVVANWLETFDFKNYEKLINNNSFHFQKFLLVNKLIVMLYHNLHVFTIDDITRLKNISYGDFCDIITQYKSDLHKLVNFVIHNFTKAIQRQLIQDEFYQSNTISDIANMIKGEYEKKDTEYIKTPYDEYMAFQDNTDEMIEPANFKTYTLKGGESKSRNVQPAKREDFYIQPSLLDYNKMFIERNRNYHYIYQNSIIKKARNANSTIVDFDLLRIKFHFELTADVTHDGKTNTQTLKIPSEFIDISICGYNDTSLYHFRNDTEHALQLYNIPYDNNGKQYSLECYGYSIDFTMHDLSYVLYAQNVFTPWVDGKYEKRIYRLTALELLKSKMTGKIDQYLKTIIFSYIVCNYCITYADATDAFIQTEPVLTVLTDIEENIVNNYEKYLFDRLSHICPITLIHSISNEFKDENINHKIPYSDDILGSLVFYSCIIRHNNNGNAQNKIEAKNVIEKFRKDFLYLPLNDVDYDAMLTSAKAYLGKIRDIYVNMFTLANSQQAGQLKKTKSRKAKQNVSFY